MADSKTKARHPDVNTALHVLKGAIVKVLHTPLTTSTQAQKRDEGRIAVEYTLPEAPTKDVLDQIQDLANKKINEKVEIQYFKMDRAAAEDKYRKNPVNETFIYDKFPVPASVTEVMIVEIPEWNVNCSSGPLVKNTGDIKPIKIDRVNLRTDKKELEFVFKLVNEAPAQKKTEVAQTKAKAPVAPAVSQKDNDNVNVITDLVMEEIFAELKKLHVDLQQKEEIVKAISGPRIASKLSILKNTAFSHGFTCQPEKTKMLR
eukprot:TRINITY_DN364_c0_g1_i1.p1 TRINITY_DN364_c0_g1~~TRINITY_DN364_c0_g1_i1.p1  ORF type:complete len:260 (-),score=85.67 TRINITY_DN364_c0_g1_i1:54-833(-)